MKKKLCYFDILKRGKILRKLEGKSFKVRPLKHYVIIQ